MKNLVIIIKNLPDEAIDESWNGGLKAFGIEGTQQATIDYKEAHAVAQLRTIEAIITLQSNYIYQEIMRMPNPKKGNMLQKIKTYAFNKLFGKFNNN